MKTLRKDIRFFGFGRSWSEEVAQKQAAKLKEMGFFVRLLALAENNHLVAYSYRGFSIADAVECLARLPKSD